MIIHYLCLYTFLSAANGSADIEVQMSVRPDVRTSVCGVILTTFPKSDLNEIAHVYAHKKN